MGQCKWLSLLLFLWAISSDAQNTSSPTTDNTTLTDCPISLANNMTTDLLKRNFVTNTSSGLVYMVYFRLKYTNASGHVQSFEIADEDTFEPDLWVWAAGRGKNLLRLPLDHKILSLGLLTIQSATLEINFDSKTYSCFGSIPNKSAIHLIGKFISENITSNGTAVNTDTEGPIICRSVYAFDHIFYGTKGIGFDCCSPPNGQIKQYICDKSYSEAYQLIWYGPIVLMCLIYVAGIVHFYKLYKKSFQQGQIRQLAGLQKTIDEIKMDFIKRLVINTERWARIETPEDLIALRERCSFLDVLGVGKAKHSCIVFFLRFFFVCFLFLSYYVIWALFLWAYQDQLGTTLKRLKDSQSVFLNVVGHIGWIFCRKDLSIFPYAVFEFIYTAIVPFLAVYAYFSTWSKNRVGVMNPESESTSKQKCLCFYRFSNTRCGIALQFVSVFLVLIHFIFLGGVFLSYLVYLVALGVFANIDVVSPWIIPIILCLHFFSTSFDPAYVKYKSIKDNLFTICFDDFKNLVIKQNREIFLPRDLIENFYIPNSRSLIYSCFLKVFWVLTFMLLLILVVLTLQYPYNTKLTSLVPFLGVQVVFVLPYLAKVMSVSNQMGPLGETIIKRDLHNYIKMYIKERPELKVDSSKNNGGASPQQENTSEDIPLKNSKSSSSLLADGQGVALEFQPAEAITATNEIVKRMKSGKSSVI